MSEMRMALLGRGEAVPSFAIETVEGLRIKGTIAAKKLLHGNNALLMQVTINRGTATPSTATGMSPTYTWSRAA